jgi:hypothetical protein
VKIVSRLGLTTLVGLLVAVGSAAILVYWLGELRDWMPNVATDAFALAFALTIVDAVLKREAQERERPRRELASASLARAARTLGEAVALDYAMTHRGSYRRPPQAVDEIFGQWLDEQETADTDPPVRGLPGAVARVAEDLWWTRTTSHDVLDPPLLAEVDRFTAAAPLIAAAVQQAAPGIREDDLRSLVQFCRTLATAIANHESNAPALDFGLPSVGGDWTVFHDAHYAMIEARARGLSNEAGVRHE